MTDDRPEDTPGEPGLQVSPWSAQGVARESGNPVERVQGPDHQEFDPRVRGVQGPTHPGSDNTDHQDHDSREVQGLAESETGGRVAGEQGPGHSTTVGYTREDYLGRPSEDYPTGATPSEPTFAQLADYPGTPTASDVSPTLSDQPADHAGAADAAHSADGRSAADQPVAGSPSPADSWPAAAADAAHSVDGRPAADQSVGGSPSPADPWPAAEADAAHSVAGRPGADQSVGGSRSPADPWPAAEADAAHSADGPPVAGSPPPADPWSAAAAAHQPAVEGPASRTTAEHGQSGYSSRDQVLYGTAFSGHHSYAGQPVADPYAPPQTSAGQPQRIAAAESPRRTTGGLVAGMTVLALIVGGAAGAAGGYLVAESRSPVSTSSALDTTPAKQASTPAPAGSVEAVAQKVLPSVVQLQVRGRSSAGEGSGFVISQDGLIVTNNHVVEAAADEGEIVAVFQDGRTAKATIVGRDPSSDLAVVRAERISGLTVVELGSSSDLRVGQSVVAIGSPFELSGTVTSGIVSSLNRPTRAGGEDGSQATVMDAIQTDAAINPGNSGGPLVNMRGEVVGINSAIYSPRSGSGQGGSVGIGFAIPIDQARRTADEIVKTGKATQTVLGVSVRDNNGGGALISQVVPGGAGEKAGLTAGDVITRLNDRRIDTSDALVAAVRSHAPGDKVKLVIGDGERTVEATLAGQPVETE